MIGKTSMKREKQNRYGKEYRSAKYLRMLGLKLVDGKIEGAQETIWLLEARLHKTFGQHKSWDKDEAGGAVKKGTEANYYFVLYLALK